MVLQLGETTVSRIVRHECAYRPFINSTGGYVSLEQLRRDKRFQHKPPAKIHAISEWPLGRNGSENTMEIGW